MALVTRHAGDDVDVTDRALHHIGTGARSLGVALRTVARSSTEYALGMAGLAGSKLVVASQGKAGFLVVEGVAASAAYLCKRKPAKQQQNRCSKRLPEK